MSYATGDSGTGSTLESIHTKFMTESVKKLLKVAPDEKFKEIIQFLLRTQGEGQVDPEAYMYDLDLKEIAEVWRRGSVIGSWLLDLTAEALYDDPDLSRYGGHVSDSGEGRWTINAAIDEGVPVPVLSAALYQRFASRGRDDVANKALSAMRAGFGGHKERTESTR